MTDLTVPDEFDDWPFDAKHIALANTNTRVELRNEIADHVGFKHVEDNDESYFRKMELAMILMGLGGPHDD